MHAESLRQQLRALDKVFFVNDRKVLTIHCEGKLKDLVAWLKTYHNHVVNLKDVLWLKIWLKYKLSAIYL